jgi:hypothetical protein
MTVNSTHLEYDGGRSSLLAGPRRRRRCGSNEKNIPARPVWQEPRTAAGAARGFTPSSPAAERNPHPIFLPSMFLPCIQVSPPSTAFFFRSSLVTFGHLWTFSRSGGIPLDPQSVSSVSSVVNPFGPFMPCGDHLIRVHPCLSLFVAMQFPGARPKPVSKRDKKCQIVPNRAMQLLIPIFSKLEKSGQTITNRSVSHMGSVPNQRKQALPFPAVSLTSVSG